MRSKSQFLGSNQPRRSNIKNPTTHVKTDILPYLNLLDKCTQILREDRLWVRNQLKSGNQDLLALFKNARKPLNLQHLQIKLRKHITAVKSKAKMEQLMKFKENMHLGHKKEEENAHDKDDEIKNNKNKKGWFKESKSSSYCVPSYKNSGYSVGKAQKNTNNSLEKSSKNANIEKTFSQTSYFQSTFKARERQYPSCNMQKITERQSENVTSARQRIFPQENFPQKTIEPAVTKKNPSIQSNFNMTYNRWQPPSHTSSKSQTSFFNQIRAMMEQKSEKEEQHGFSRFIAGINENYDEIPIHKKSQNQLEEDHEKKFEAISQQVDNKIQNYEIIDSDYQNSSINYKYMDQDVSSKKNLHSNQKPLEKQPQFSQFHAPQDPFRRHERVPSYTEHVFRSVAQIESEKKQLPSSENENLFTSPQLLMECRKFIKSKGSTSQKKNNQELSNYSKHSFQKIEHSPFKLEEIQERPLQIDCVPETTFSNMLKNTQKSKFQQSQYTFPVAIGQSSEKKEQGYESNFENPQQFSSGNYEYFHTFAASNQKQQSQPIQTINSQPEHEPSVEQVLNTIISQNPESYMNKSSLISLMQAYYPSCIPLIKSGLPQTDDVAVCEVGRLLQKYLPTSGESQVFNVYRLLDFSKKGYITLEDIEEFLCQLSQAETDDVEQIRECLCQIVQGMVPMKQQDLFDYWSLYCMKQCDEFKSLCELLQQYEFEIEDEEI